jgi:hypothetical protein
LLAARRWLLGLATPTKLNRELDTRALKPFIGTTFDRLDRTFSKTSLHPLRAKHKRGNPESGNSVDQRLTRLAVSRLDGLSRFPGSKLALEAAELAVVGVDELGLLFGRLTVLANVICGFTQGFDLLT